jgi:hypothetical protein
MRTEVKYILELIRDKTITIDNGTDRILNLFGVSDSNSFYIVEIRKYYPKGSTPYTEFSNLFLSDKLEKSISFIQEDVDDRDGFTSNGKNYHWYWVIIKVKLNDDTGGEIVKVYDKNGVETTERIMLDLD